MFTDFYPSQHCIEMSYKCENTTDLGERLMGQLEAISKFIQIDTYPWPTRCLDIKQQNNFSLSGYYTIRAPNGSLISVYCDMKGSKCDGKGGWMRIGYLNMTESGATCHPGLTLQQYNNINHGLCDDWPNPSSGGCSSTKFSTLGLSFYKVCGQVRGYQYGRPNGFFPLIKGIDSYYVCGVSITHGQNPRKRIWTYAGGLREDRSDWNGCPCNTGYSGSRNVASSFVGNHYYCESGLDPDKSYDYCSPC